MAVNPINAPEPTPPVEVESDVDPQIRDIALMRGVQAGSARAFEALMRHYWPLLTAFAAGYVARQDTAEDVVQEVFVRLWVQRGRWKPTGSVRGYLYRMTRNLALNARRSSKARERREQVWHDGAEASIAFRPDDTFHAATLRAAFDEAIRSLPQRRREIFILARYDDLSYAEIAEVLGISPQTVANQLSRALSALRQGLRPHLGP